MNDPYSVLGVSPDAGDEEVKKAYRALAKKYHPDNYQNNPLADLAEEKMKEINEAYDAITKARAGGGYAYQTQSSSGAAGQSQGYGGQSYAYGQDPFFLKVRQVIQAGNLAAAERMLTQEATVKNAEWYFLMGVVCYGKGWLDEARQNYQMATQLDPNNPEYRQAYAMMTRGGYAYQPARYQSSDDVCGECCKAYLCISCLTPWGGPCC